MIIIHFVGVLMNIPFSSIQFPDPQSRYHSNQVTITGSVDGVFRAIIGQLVYVRSCDHHM